MDIPLQIFIVALEGTLHRAFMTLLLTGFLLIRLDGDELISAQPGEPSSKKDSYPISFKVYSTDGRESLTASCSPPNLTAEPHDVNEIDCRFTHVRFSNPHERVDKNDFSMPTTSEELAKLVPGFEEELKKDARKADEFSRSFRTLLEQGREEGCSKYSQVWQSKVKNSQPGSKRQKYFQGIIEACQKKDPTMYYKQITDMDRRSCYVWVDTFSPSNSKESI